ASSVAITAGGDAFRSMTDTRVSGTVFVGSPGSTLLDDPTRARLSSGVSATLSGGPTTLPGTAISATTRGGDTVRSRSVTVSVARFAVTMRPEVTDHVGLAQDHDADEGDRAARTRGAHARARDASRERAAADAAVPRRHRDRDVRARLLLGRREGVLAHARRR